MLEALIFDVDGTLAETEELHRRAFNETFAAAGLDWHWTQGDYHRLLKTTGGKERIQCFMDEAGPDTAAVDIPALHAAKTTRFVDLIAAGQIALRPGISELMRQARASGVRLAVATTTSQPNVEALCAAVFGKPADQVFDVIACGDMVKAKKPAPDVYLLALDGLRLSARQAIALEDSYNGMRAAKAAGLRCCVAPCTYTQEEDFAAADLVVAEFSDLRDLSDLEALLEMHK